MATDITGGKTQPITSDGDYFMSVVEIRPAVVKATFDADVTAGTVTIKDSQGDAYRNEANDGDLSVAFNAGLNKFNIDPTGGHINFTVAGIADGGLTINVISQDTAK